jgi:uncharacterized C2H2 Zn-finger protein
MRLFCGLGIHRWTKKMTARPGTTVNRCRRCDKVVVKHAQKAWQRG